MRTLLLLVSALTLAAQSIQVSGRVLTIDGTPIEAAKVSLESPGMESSVVVTDAKGAFKVQANGNRLHFRVDKQGFIPLENWVEESRTLTVRLGAASSITGRVLDPNGRPVPKASLTAYNYSYRRGVRALTESGYTAATDANGIYTFSNLISGRYFLRVEASGPAVTTYYPSTLDPAAAAAIDVSGATKSGIDIRQRNDPVFRIRGKIIDEKGTPAAHAVLTIIHEEPIVPLVPPSRILAAADGSFEFKDLIPGRYVIRSYPTDWVVVQRRFINTRPTSAQYAGRLDVVITRNNIDGLTFKVNRGYRLVGKVRRDDGSALPVSSSSANRIEVRLYDAEQTFTISEQNIVPSQTGMLLFEKIVPGKYYVYVNFPPNENLYVKSVKYRERDITRSTIDLRKGGGDNLEIVLGTKPGTINVTVRDPREERLLPIAVVLWPDISDNGNSWPHVRGIATNENGIVRFTGLRPGKYYLAAFPLGEAEFLNSPDFLDHFKDRAVQLDVSEGASLDRTLELPFSREDVGAVIRNLP